MIKMKNLSFSAAALLCVLLTLPACEKTNIPGADDILSPDKKFDMDLFQTNVEAGLGNQWAGYAYVISQNGQFSRGESFGQRRTGNDGNAGMEITTPLYGASVGKVVTAVAMLKILEEYGNGDAGFMLNAKIYQYLPPNWTFGPNTDNITFRNLLEHRSGISGSAAIDYSGIRALIATGTAADKSYQYSNANYAILRILVASMSGNAQLANINNDQVAGTTVLTGFSRYVDTKLLQPLDLDFETQPSGNAPALYYRWGELTDGWNMGDMSDRLGNGGYYFSPADFAKFMAYLNHTETLLSKNTRNLMYQQYLGWSDEAQPQNEPEGDYGKYYYKGGSFCNESENGVCGGKGVRNIVACFPENGVEIIIMGNTRGGSADSTPGLRTMLRNAYDNAWVK